MVPFLSNFHEPYALVHNHIRRQEEKEPEVQPLETTNGEEETQVHRVAVLERMEGEG